MGSCARIAVWLLLALCACKAATTVAPHRTPAAKSDGTAATGPSSVSSESGSQTSGSGGEPGMETKKPDGSSASPDAGSGSAPKPDGGAHVTKPDAGTMPVADAGSMKLDGGSIASDAAAADGQVGMLGMGSCCTAHDTPGCSNADLQVCVCEKLSSCCTAAWDAPCVLIVQQKYCQPGVRDCVCGDGSGQWGQHDCCNIDWTDTFCNQVAQSKCGAASGCL